MVCTECGCENKDDALFCARCGSNLSDARIKRHSRKCEECGYDNLPDGKYCASCGAELRRHQYGPPPWHGRHAQPRQQTKRERRVNTRLKWHPGLVGVVMVVGIVAVIFTVERFVVKKPSAPARTVETRSSDVTVEAQVQTIASKFICSCGTCGEEPLDKCTCKRAVDERQFIRNYLELGQKPEQVILALNTRYGWIKPQFASLAGDSAAMKTAAVKSNLARSRPEVSLPPITFQEPARADPPAAAADRERIFSRFQCPCGQCQVDELRDCGCRHPRGAREVKAFVDARIGENKYTVAQVIEMVAAKYGGKKL